MRKSILWLVAVSLAFLPAAAWCGETKVPAGKEELVIDTMSKAKEAIKKKVLKGPVPFKHQAHVDKGIGCLDCHHETKEGETPKHCGDCHKEKETKEVIKIDDAFHGGENETLPSLHSCIGCHRRKVYERNASTSAPWQRKPCEACHSLRKK